MVSKKDIRKDVLNIRNKMNEIEWETNSHSICEKVVTHSIFLESDSILCYMDYNNEVGTKRIMEEAWKARKEVFVPKVKGTEMEFYRINSWNDVASGFRGILEPLNNEAFQAKEGLMIMPGVAFDKERNRIGYGKGYYDKYLSRHPYLKTIAVAFECQLVDHIEADCYDIKPEFLMTEENIYD